MTVPGVTVVIAYRALPGKGDTARAELAGLIAEVLAKEPDCLGIELQQEMADDTRVLLYERWTSRDAYTGPHMRTPHIQAFIQRAGAFLAGPPEITFWSRVPVD